MKQQSITTRVLIALVLAAVLATLSFPAMAQQPAAKANPIQFLTAPQAGVPLDLAKAYLAGNLESLGLSAGDLEGMVVSDHYMSRHNGVTHVYFQQTHRGIPLYNGLININVTRDGAIINLGNRFVGDLASKINTTTPSLAPDAAIQSAASHLGLAPEGLELLSNKGGVIAKSTFSAARISQDPIPVELRYLATDDGVRLVWDTVINRTDNPDWWNLQVDALSGDVLNKHNWTNYEVEGGGPPSSYDVFPVPAEDPDDDAFIQTTVVSPEDLTASPLGWHDNNGVAGADFTDTRGNNVLAQDDLDANNVGGSRPDGGAGLAFNIFWDPAMQPGAGTNLDASIVNLFYYNNIMHDITYQYGFDVPAGNFQTFHYPGQGAGSANDPVIADAQDGSDLNNANFSTPPDGFSGRMQMFVWTPPAILTVNSPGNIAGEYPAGSAGFGAALAGAGITGDFILVDDGSLGDGTGTTSDSCEASPANAYDGLIAVLDRGSCEFGTKVLNAENAGAIAAVVINNQGDGVQGMGPGADGGSVTISSVFIGQSNGEAIKDELPTPGVNGTMEPFSLINRDSDFDNGIIAHEYGHGISNRLTGGPGNVNCLFGDERQGEGWSDFWALVLTARPGDTATQARGIGTYVAYEDSDGAGIRNFPYSTDLAVNPQTYADIGDTNVPHGVGEIWMTAVWEMYWELVHKHGFDADFYNGTGGNNLAIQLVVDGMKLQPCGPTFVTARDAILLADMNNNGGANQCEIWRAFGKRGVGVSADDGGSTTVGNEVEAFDVPPGCEAELFIDGFESGNTAMWDNSAGEI